MLTLKQICLTAAFLLASNALLADSHLSAGPKVCPAMEGMEGKEHCAQHEGAACGGEAGADCMHKGCADGQSGCMHGKHGMHGMHAMHGGNGEPDGMSMFERMGADLALTEAQKQEFAALMEMYRPRLQELWERGKENRQVLLAMAPDDPAYRARTDEMSALAGASAAETVTLLSELQSNAYALLTREQQAKFMQKRAEQRERMEKMQADHAARRESGEHGPGMPWMQHMHSKGDAGKMPAEGE